MKKIIALVLSLMFVFALTACTLGGNDNSGANAENSINSTQGATSVKNSTTSSKKQGTKSSEKQSTTVSAFPNTPADKNPVGKTMYVREGGVIYYPTETWEKSFGGIAPKNCADSEVVLRFSVAGQPLDEQIEVFKTDYPSYQSAEKMTIAGHNAAKCIYVGNVGTQMRIIFDTPFTNDKFYSAYIITVYASQDNVAFFDDATVWEIINSFYFDKSKKYTI